MAQTFDEILKERLATPATLKGTNRTIMPMEAMATSVVNNAMKGDIPSIMFINNMTKDDNPDSEEYKEEQQKIFLNTFSELRDELTADGLWIGQYIECELLARQLMTLRRLAGLQQKSTHEDIEETVTKNGIRQHALSFVDRLHADMLKQFRADLDRLRASAAQRIMQKKLLKK